MMPSVLVFSRKTWLELSDDEQKAIRSAAKDSVGFLRQHIESPASRDIQAEQQAAFP
jgi:TRAP-type C4-dicarboxylate transport system substrate-binding protein